MSIYLPAPKYCPMNIIIDVPAFAVRDIRRPSIATRRNKDLVHIAKKRNKVRHDMGWTLWHDEPKDYGKNVGKFADYRGGKVSDEPQPGRYNKFSTNHQGNPYKRFYKSPDIELADKLEEADRRYAKYDAKRDQDFYEYLMEGEKADALSDEYDKLIKDSVEELRKYFWVVDDNHPGVVFISKCRERLVKFRLLLQNEGACMGRVISGANCAHPGDIITWTRCNIDKEWDGSKDINPFHFWYY